MGCVSFTHRVCNSYTLGVYLLHIPKQESGCGSTPPRREIFIEHPGWGERQRVEEPAHMDICEGGRVSVHFVNHVDHKGDILT